jgi:hypothetical protein
MQLLRRISFRLELVTAVVGDLKSVMSHPPQEAAHINDALMYAVTLTQRRKDMPAHNTHLQS